MTQLDFAPLTTPVSREEIAAFKRETKAGVGGYSAISAASIVKTVITIILLIVFVALFGSTIFSIVVSSDGLMSESVTLVVVVVVAVIVGAFLVIRRLVSRGTWRRWLKLTRFATANGLGYAANASSPGYPGSIFSVGKAQQVPEHLYRSGSHFLDLGNYRYTTGSGKSKTTHDWGYLAIKLDRMLPQMVLDAKANNFLGTNLPVSFSRSQVLSLEGDFDRYFTLYCPKEYERDALYVFTPDLMALLIDEAALFDVEIVDDWMFVYSAKTFDLADPATLARAFRIIDTVGDKTLDRTELYADANVVSGAAIAASGSPLGARMAANTVAPQGRRLRKGFSVATIVVVVAVALYAAVTFLPIFGDF